MFGNDPTTILPNNYARPAGSVSSTIVDQDDDLPEDRRNQIDFPVPDYIAMSSRWDLLHDLLGGTGAMRAAGEKWLPREPAEDQGLWELRLRRSYLYEAYGDTIKKLVAKPFSRPVQLVGTPPKRLQGIEKDVDFTGTNLTQFGRDVFQAGLVYGMTHVLVDMPSKIDVANRAGVPTMEDERRIRPRFIHVPPPSLIGWQPAPGTSDNPGADRLGQIRIKETKTEPSGRDGVEIVSYIRLYDEEGWELWRRGEDDKDYSQVDAGSHTFGAVPLVTFYIDRTGLLTAAPPLEDLAWLNLAHYQSLSDQRHLLRVARVPILFAAGLDQKEFEAGIIVGANQLIRVTNDRAKLTYVEHSGKALGAGEADLRHLEERMMILGLDP